MMPNDTEKETDEHTIERLKVALRQCYALAWNIQEANRDNAGQHARAQEIRDTAMRALRGEATE